MIGFISDIVLALPEEIFIYRLELMLPWPYRWPLLVSLEWKYDVNLENTKNTPSLWYLPCSVGFLPGVVDKTDSRITVFTYSDFEWRRFLLIPGGQFLDSSLNLILSLFLDRLMYFLNPLNEFAFLVPDRQWCDRYMMDIVEPNALHSVPRFSKLSAKPTHFEWNADSCQRWGKFTHNLGPLALRVFQTRKKGRFFLTYVLQ